jgi:hypothetical protein
LYWIGKWTKISAAVWAGGLRCHAVGGKLSIKRAGIEERLRHLDSQSL